jgi:filamentous hemagglutinin
MATTAPGGGAGRPAERAALEARQAAAATGEEIAKAEPVAGQLPRNHAYAGHEYPRSALPSRYQKQGLRFKETGYPDFEPYAKVLPNGEKKVRIAYTGSRRADFTAAREAAGLERTPKGYTWHHDEADMGTMYLVPDDLHDAIKHTGGVAEYKHRHGVPHYGD